MVTNILRVQGMHCASCTKRVEFEVGDLDGVEEVEADFKEDLVTVTYNPEKVELDRIIATILDEGFTVAK